MRTGRLLFFAVFLAVAGAAYYYICAAGFYTLPVNSRCHLEAVLRAWQAVKGGAAFPGTFFSLNTMGVGSYYPVLAHTCYLGALLVYPVYQALFIPNLICYLAAAVAVQRISGVFLGDGFLSYLAAAIFMLYPSVVFMLTACEVQMFTLAFIAWGFYCYLRSENFSRFWPSAFFCLFFVLGMYSDRLTPGIFLAACLMNPRNFRLVRSRLGLAVVLAAALIACLPHYLQWIGMLKNPACVNTMITRNNVPITRVLDLLKSDIGYILAQVYYYPAAFPDQLLGAWFSLLSCAGLFGLRKFVHPLKGFLIFSLILPAAVFMLFPKKDWVYLFPLLVIIPVATVCGLSSLKKTGQGFVLVVVILAGFLSLSYLLPVNGRLRRLVFTDFLSYSRQLHYPNMIIERFSPTGKSDPDISGRFKELL